jgi:pimeloyl-ACP methyl ester carboxylesterase
MRASVRYSTWFAALLLSAAVHAQPPAAEDDRVSSASFRILIQGRPVGTEEVSVIELDGRTVIRSTAGIEGGNFSLRSAEIVYGPGNTPVSMQMEVVVRGQTQTVATTFDGSKATSRITRGEATEEKTDTVSPTTVIFPNNVFGAVEGLGRRLLTMEPGASLRVYVAPQAEVDARLTAVETERIQTADGTFDVRRHTVDVSNPGAPLAVVVWVEAKTGRLVRYSIPAAGVDVVREDITSVFTRAVRVFRENDEEDMIPANGFNLAATISRPPGTAAPAPKAKNVPRLPAVILLAGSGELDRDGVAFGVPILGQLAGALADAGYLVVRFDKRGVGQSGGRAESATLPDYAEDVLAVVRAMKRRKDVDGKRIALVGHSEGGAVALLAAARTKDIAAVVSIAGPGVTGSELILAQQKHALGRLSLPDEEKQKRMALQTQIMNAVLTGDGWDGVPEPLRKQAETPWFRSLLAYDPAEPLRKANQPLLIVQPALDTQVAPGNADALLALAEARKNGRGAQVVTLPGLNHLLVPAKTGEVSEYGTLEDRTISPDVGAAIADWLGRTLPDGKR